MNENPTRTVISLMFFPILSAMGCAQDIAGPSSDPHPCISNEDCRGYSRCIQNVCEAPSVSTDVVHFELIPPVSSDLVPTQITNVDPGKTVSSEDGIKLEMSKAIHLEHVISDIPLEKSGVAGILWIKRFGGITNRSLFWNIQTGRDGKASMDLPEGRYDMVFKPLQREEFPQILLTGLDLPDRLDLPMKYPVYPDKQNIVEQNTIMLVKGVVRLDDTAYVTTTQLKVEGVAVFEDTGRYELYTNLATPDKNGLFFLRLPIHYKIGKDGLVERIHPTKLNLMIRPKSSSTLAPIIATHVNLENFDLGDFYVGKIPKEYIFSGTVLDTQGRPIPACQLWFESDQIANGSYTAACTTDDSGAFTIGVPEGLYRITLLPPLRANAKIDNFDLNLTKQLKEHQFILQPRPLLKGTIFDDRGRFVPGVVIKAKKLPDDFYSNRIMLRTFETTSNQFGAFELGTDGGVYELILIPPASSNLARSLPTIIEINQSISSLPRDVSTLPVPHIIQGHLFGPNNETLCGVTIYVYTLDDQDYPRLIGKTISSEASKRCDGSYTVIVPQIKAPYRTYHLSSSLPLDDRRQSLDSSDFHPINPRHLDINEPGEFH